MRRFAFVLLSISLLPASSLWSQSGPTSTESAIPAELADADIVSAAELEGAITELETAHAQNYNTLASIIDKVPADARPALEQALENSKRGYLQARSNRERTTAMRQAKANSRLARLNAKGAQGKPATFGQNGVGGQGAAMAAQNGRGPTGNGQMQMQGQAQRQGQLQAQGELQPQGQGQATRIATAPPNAGAQMKAGGQGSSTPQSLPQNRGQGNAPTRR